MELRFFKKSEFRCRCGCCGLGYAQMDGELLTRLDRARELAGVPLVLSSAIRCPAHNRAVGGGSSSSHLKGLAVDILTPGNQARGRLISALAEAGLGARMGIAPDFVHVDLDFGKPAPCVWLYRAK